jgi:hypothetical protein
MSFDYSEDAATAIEMIAEFGRAMTLRSQTNSGTAWDPTIVNVDTAIVGVMLEYEAHERDSLIQASDKKVLTTSSPTVAMKLIDGGVVYEIVSVKPLQPGDTVILSEIQARKG